jgi:hypothetical protein
MHQATRPSWGAHLVGTLVAQGEMPPRRHALLEAVQDVKQTSHKETAGISASEMAGSETGVTL